MINYYVKNVIIKLINEGNHDWQALAQRFNVRDPIDIQEISELVSKELDRIQADKELRERLRPENIQKASRTPLYLHQIHEIRRKYAEKITRNNITKRKYSMQDLANEYHVSPTTIFNAVHMFNADDGRAYQVAVKHHKARLEKQENSKDKGYKKLRGPLPKPDDPDEFWALVDRRGPQECWPWKGSRPTHNWQGDRDKPRHMSPHKVAANIGIPGYPSISLDQTTYRHGCIRTTNCCNPAHIESKPLRNPKKFKKLKWADAAYILLQITTTCTPHEQILNTYNITQSQLDWIIQNPELIRKKTLPKRFLLEAAPYQPQIRNTK